MRRYGHRFTAGDTARNNHRCLRCGETFARDGKYIGYYCTDCRALIKAGEYP